MSVAPAGPGGYPFPMLATALSSFIVGVLLARAFPSPWLVAHASLPLLLAVLALAGKFRLSRVVSPAFCVWGWAHAGPFPHETMAGATVVAVAVSDDASGPVLVQAGSHVYEVYGRQRPGSVGRVLAAPSRRLFGTTRGTAQVGYVPGEAEPGVMPRLVTTIRGFFGDRAASLSRFHARWLSGLVLGTRAALPRDVSEAFKRTGLYHLLAVSGMHVTLMAFVMGALLRAPAQVGYALRWVSPEAWRHVSGFVRVLAAMAAILYLGVTGSPPAAQRAALLFAVWQLAAVFCGALPLRTRLLLAAVAQAVIFPVGYLSEGALMSWAAYLVVIVALHRRQEGLFGPLASMVWTQAQLLVLVAAVFGQVVLIGLVANLVLIPVFSFLLVTGLVAMAGEGLPGRGALLAMHDSFIGIVRIFAGLCDSHPWLSLTDAELPGGVRQGFVLLSAVILLNTVRHLSIRGASSQGGSFDVGQAMERPLSGHHR